MADSDIEHRLKELFDQLGSHPPSRCTALYVLRLLNALANKYDEQASDIARSMQHSFFQRDDADIATFYMEPMIKYYNYLQNLYPDCSDVLPRFVANEEPRH